MAAVKRIAFIGLGTMGAPMAANLLKAGFEVTVHNRTREREEPLASQGAQRAESPAEAASQSEVVITMVADAPDVREVLLGPHGAATQAPKGTVFVDMSTISADAAREIGEELSAKGFRFVDAPVSGGSEGAEKATLTIMAGGSADDVKKVGPVLEAMGSKITHIGELGSGQATKAVNQVIAAGMYEAVAEGVILGLTSGLDMDKALEAIKAGACRSWVLENRAGNMLNDSYPLGFKVSLHRKDLRIALEAAEKHGADLPAAKLVAEIEDELIKAGRGDDDFSALAAELRRRAGL